MLMFRCRSGMAYRDLDMLLRHCKVTHGRVPTGQGPTREPSPPPPTSYAEEQRRKARERVAEWREKRAG